MEDHLRIAVAYWRSFAWPGGDPFGGQTFERPWFGDTMELADLKADVAFELFSLLGTPFYCFLDADVGPEAATFRESAARLEAVAGRFARRQEETGVKLLWGKANLFSQRRFMARAATNPEQGHAILAGRPAVRSNTSWRSPMLWEFLVRST